MLAWKDEYLIGVSEIDKQHDKFIKTVNDIDLNKVDEDQDAYLLSILEFVVNWTCEHILQNDKLITQK